jgi:tetrahydromethanopterin S-methyltransferase subunit G
MIQITMQRRFKNIHNRLNVYDKAIEELKKQLDTEDAYKPTGKCKKPRHRLNAIDKEIDEIKKQLDNALKTLLCIIGKQAFSKIKGIDEQESKKIREELKRNGVIDEMGSSLLLTHVR